MMSWYMQGIQAYHVGSRIEGRNKHPNKLQLVAHGTFAGCRSAIADVHPSLEYFILTYVKALHPRPAACSCLRLAPQEQMPACWKSQRHIATHGF